MPTTNPWDDFQPQVSQAQSQSSSGNPWDDFKPQVKDPGLFNTVSDNAVQGATFGLGNRAEAGLAALALTAMNNKGFSQNYTDARQAGQQQLKDEMQQHPVASIASNLGGGLATGNLLGDTAAGSALANSLRSGPLWARAAKGAALGSATGAAYGAGTADEGQALQGAQQGAVTGAATGGALPVAGAALSDVGEGIANRVKGLFNDSADALQKKVSDAFANGSSLINSAQNAGVTLTPQAQQKVASDVENAIGSLNGRHSDTAAELADLKSAAQNGTLNLSTLEEFRQNFGDVVSDNTKSKIDGGGLNSDGYKGLQAKNAIRDAYSTLGANDLTNGSPQALEDLNNGLSQWADASRKDRIADLITKSDGDPNALARNFKKFLDNDSNTRGFSDSELDALKNVAQRGTGEYLERALGTFGFDAGKVKNNVVPAITAGGSAIIPGGLPLALAGTVLRQTGKLAARGKAQDAFNAIGQQLAQSPASPISALLSAPVAGLAQQIESKQPLNVAQPQAQTIAAPAQPMSYNTIQTQPSSVPDISSFAKAESSNNPNAKNPDSSASGLYQFTNKTWADMVNKYGQQTGIKLSDKSDPQSQAVMARLLAQDNIKSLQSTIGRTPTKGELYMAHVLGANGAAKLINAQGSDKEGVMLFPRQVLDANRTIFFNGKTPRTADEVYQLLNNKV